MLGVPGLDADPAWRLAAAFLLGYRGHTRRAYFADIRAWYAWCASIDLAPLSAQRHHVDRWIAEQLEHPQPGTGKPASAATVTRRLSCLAGLYEYGVRGSTGAKTTSGGFPGGITQLRPRAAAKSTCR